MRLQQVQQARLTVAVAIAACDQLITLNKCSDSVPQLVLNVHRTHAHNI